MLSCVCPEPVFSLQLMEPDEQENGRAETSTHDPVLSTSWWKGGVDGGDGGKGWRLWQVVSAEVMAVGSGNGRQILLTIYFYLSEYIDYISDKVINSNRILCGSVQNI